MVARRIAWIALFGLLVSLATESEARADVTRQARQLRTSDNFKVRLSAALSLSKSRDPRAVTALARALKRDSSPTIRRVAVNGLKRILSRSVRRRAARIGLSALERASASDRNRKVRRAAARAYAVLRRRSKGGAFVALGRPSVPRRSSPRGMRRQIASTVSKAVKRDAPGVAVYALRSAPRSRGWFVGARVAKLRVRKRGRSAEVSCQVTVRVSPLINRRERLSGGKTASAKGSGRVVGGSSKRAIAGSKRQCILAVVEQVTESQVLPFIKRAANRRIAGN